MKLEVGVFDRTIEEQFVHRASLVCSLMNLLCWKVIQIFITFMGPNFIDDDYLRV